MPYQTIKQCKQLIQENSAELIAQFKSDRPITELIQMRADFIDKLLIDKWQQLTENLGERISLIAVGGYGRRELHLHADIDLLILVEEPLETCRQTLSDFINFLWDIGLKPGHSVRTVDECLEMAIADQTVMTNLLESRLLIGSNALFDALKLKLTPENLWHSAAFFKAKIAEQAVRYAKYNDTAYNLEPNIKEGPGGLRDIQLIAWIIKRHYQSQDLRNLIIHGWLTESEFAELIEARDFLWRVRFALHALTGRCEDRLLFDHQKEIAQQFGYPNEKVNQAVELFMQRYFRTVMGIERLNEMVLQLFEEVVLDAQEESQILSIDSHFQAVNNYIEAIRPNVFKEHPLALLNIFLVLQQNNSLQGIRAATIRLIRQHIYLIDDDFRRNPKACKLFMEILRQPGGITHQLRRMNRYGLLAAYLPPFGNVVGRMQYDLFHFYTVDEHTLFVIRNLRRFALEKHREEHPHCNEIFQLIEKPEILYIAGLLHDIAKGSGGDHSVLGESIAKEFCERHAIEKRDAQLIQWLVRNHLLMSMTAQRKDISNDEVILEFTQAVGDQDTLNHLYLLTVADIRATNPSLWNSWKSALLRELFTASRWVFRRGVEKPLALTDKIKSIKKEARNILHRLGIHVKTIDRVWKTTTDEYFLRYLPEEIAWHTVAIASCDEKDLPLILLRPFSQRGSAEIFLYAKKQDSIFAHSTAVLDQLGLTIFDAKIITISNGYVLNSYHVLDQSGEPIRDQSRQIQICTKLRESLLNQGGTPIAVQRREARQIKHFTVPTQVYFHEDPQNRHTIIELIATDRPGLLSKVGQVFAQEEIHLYNAKISTIGSRAEDIFYITDRDDKPLQQASQKKRLLNALLTRVGEQ